VTVSEDEIEHFNFIEVLVAFRVFCKDGLKLDSEGRNYNGWSSKYDEWISVTNPRIQKYNTFARKIYLLASNQHDDIVIDD